MPVRSWGEAAPFVPGAAAAASFSYAARAASGVSSQPTAAASASAQQRHVAGRASETPLQTGPPLCPIGMATGMCMDRACAYEHGEACPCCLRQVLRRGDQRQNAEHIESCTQALEARLQVCASSSFAPTGFRLTGRRWKKEKDAEKKSRPSEERARGERETQRELVSKEDKPRQEREGKEERERKTEITEEVPSRVIDSVSKGYAIATSKMTRIATEMVVEEIEIESTGEQDEQTSTLRFSAATKADRVPWLYSVWSEPCNGGERQRHKETATHKEV